MMNKHLHSFLLAVLGSLLLATMARAETPETKGTSAKPRAGLAVHYYRDDPHWGGNWTTDFLPKVDPDRWVFSRYLFTRAEELINHSFLNRSWFSMRAVGTIEIAKKAEDDDEKEKEVTFYLVMDHGARLLVNGKVVVDGWKPKRGGGREVAGKVKLPPGKHSLVVEGLIGSNNRLKDGLILKLLWESDGFGIKKGVVPATSLSHDDSHLVPKPGRKKPSKKTE